MHEMPLPVSQHTFKYLGIHGHRLSGPLIQNKLGRAINGLHASTVFWKRLPLSPMGRLALAKMIALPRLLYYLSTIPMVVPTKIFKERNTWLAHFVWDDMRHCVALSTFFYPPEMGGLAAPDYGAY